MVSPNHNLYENSSDEKSSACFLQPQLGCDPLHYSVPLSVVDDLETFFRDDPEILSFLPRTVKKGVFKIWAEDIKDYQFYGDAVEMSERCLDTQSLPEYNTKPMRRKRRRIRKVTSTHDVEKVVRYGNFVRGKKTATCHVLENNDLVTWKHNRSRLKFVKKRNSFSITNRAKRRKIATFLELWKRNEAETESDGDVSSLSKNPFTRMSPREHSKLKKENTKTRPNKVGNVSFEELSNLPLWPIEDRIKAFQLSIAEVMQIPKPLYESDSSINEKNTLRVTLDYISSVKDAYSTESKISTPNDFDEAIKTSLSFPISDRAHKLLEEFESNECCIDINKSLDNFDNVASVEQRKKEVHNNIIRSQSFQGSRIPEDEEILLKGLASERANEIRSGHWFSNSSNLSPDDTSILNNCDLLDKNISLLAMEYCNHVYESLTSNYKNNIFTDELWVSDGENIVEKTTNQLMKAASMSQSENAVPDEEIKFCEGKFNFIMKNLNMLSVSENTTKSLENDVEIRQLSGVVERNLTSIKDAISSRQVEKIDAEREILDAFANAHDLGDENRKNQGNVKFAVESLIHHDLRNAKKESPKKYIAYNKKVEKKYCVQNIASAACSPCKLSVNKEHMLSHLSAS